MRCTVDIRRKCQSRSGSSEHRFEHDKPLLTFFGVQLKLILNRLCPTERGRRLIRSVWTLDALAHATVVFVTRAADSFFTFLSCISGSIFVIVFVLHVRCLLSVPRFASSVRVVRNSCACRSPSSRYWYSHARGTTCRQTSTYLSRSACW